MLEAAVLLELVLGLVLSLQGGKTEGGKGMGLFGAVSIQRWQHQKLVLKKLSSANPSQAGAS